MGTLWRASMITHVDGNLELCLYACIDESSWWPKFNDFESVIQSIHVKKIQDTVAWLSIRAEWSIPAALLWKIWTNSSTVGQSRSCISHDIKNVIKWFYWQTCIEHKTRRGSSNFGNENVSFSTSVRDSDSRVSNRAITFSQSLTVLYSSHLLHFLDQ